MDEYTKTRVICAHVVGKIHIFALQPDVNSVTSAPFHCAAQFLDEYTERRVIWLVVGQIHIFALQLCVINRKKGPYLQKCFFILFSNMSKKVEF